MPGAAAHVTVEFGQGAAFELRVDLRRARRRRVSRQRNSTRVSAEMAGPPAASLQSSTSSERGSRM
ncbi:MAG: hypothetical protein IPJ52_04420 [Rhodocyclaceae bacterium]|nr:hypothetical protein [Rhodocyclaceae bacterium]